LLLLRSLGPVSSWVLSAEFFGWRTFSNRRQLAACAGLTGSPYASGSTSREQGLSKGGNRRVRTLMIELSWIWLRHQPNSRIAKWWQRGSVELANGYGRWGSRRWPVAC
jgi:transposase